VILEHQNITNITSKNGEGDIKQNLGKMRNEALLKEKV